MKRIVLAFAILALAACDEQHVALVKPSYLHPEGCGKHGAAISSITMDYTFSQPTTTEQILLGSDFKIGTLVTCRDGVTVLVP